jgi:SAM-dependent methyltransferase
MNLKLLCAQPAISPALDRVELFDLLRDLEDNLGVEMHYSIRNLVDIEIDHPDFYFFYSYTTQTLSVRCNELGLNLAQPLTPPQMAHKILKRLSLIPTVIFNRISVKLNQPSDTETKIKPAEFWDHEWRLRSSDQELQSKSSDFLHPFTEVGLFYRGMEDFLLRTLDQLHIPRDSRICIPACGSGELIPKLLQRSDHYKVVAFDQSNDALQRAKLLSASIKEALVEEVVLSTGDICDSKTWSKAGPFDLIIAAGILTHPVLSKDNADTALSHITHALKPKGLLVIYGMGAHHFSAANFEIGFTVLQEYSLPMKHPFLLVEKTHG